MSRPCCLAIESSASASADGVLAAASGFDLGLFAHALRLVGGFAQHAGGVLLGPDLDLRCGLAGRGQDARGFLAEHRA